MAYVDRPVVEFFDAHVRHTNLWIYLDWLVHPFQYLLVVALFFLFGCGARLISGHVLPEWTRIPLLCSWSLMWGLGTELLFKAIFGRIGPDPGYVRDHFYYFRLLHGDPIGSAFPSGHSIGATEIAAVLWNTAPRLRIVSALLAAAMLIVLAVDNFHWVSDIIAGAFIGTTIGWMTATFPTNR
jgi:membrane-associated phospholipid phosphatase